MSHAFFVSSPTIPPRDALKQQQAKSSQQHRRDTANEYVDENTSSKKRSKNNPDFPRKDNRNLQQYGMPKAAKTAARKPRHPLPELPKGLSWPEDFDKADEFGRHPKAPGGVIAYLKRDWAKIIAAGKIDMPTLREHFPKAATAIETYVKPHSETGERRTLPKKLTIPLLKEVNTRKMLQALAGKEVVGRDERRHLNAVAHWRAKNWPRPTSG